ncbi:MAG: hypothetical protein AAF899_12935 [Pseudomonadota bacterium]
MIDHLTRKPVAAGPGTDMIPVAPNDVADLPLAAAVLYVEVGGTVSFVPLGSPTMIRSIAVDDYSYVLCAATKVLATGTTAGGIHAVVYVRHGEATS